MDWVLVVLAAWVLVSALIAVPLGRALYLAERADTTVEDPSRWADVVDIRTAATPRPGSPPPSEEASPADDSVRTLTQVDQRTRGHHGEARHRNARSRRRGG